MACSKCHVLLVIIIAAVASGDRDTHGRWRLGLIWFMAADSGIRFPGPDSWIFTNQPCDLERGRNPSEPQFPHLRWGNNNIHLRRCFEDSGNQVCKAFGTVPGTRPVSDRVSLNVVVLGGDKKAGRDGGWCDQRPEWSRGGGVGGVSGATGSGNSSKCTGGWV